MLCYLNVNRPETINKSEKIRAFRNIPVPEYRNAIKMLLNNQSKTPENINDLIDYYNSTLQNLTDKYAPLQCKTIALRPHLHWYTSALRQVPKISDYSWCTFRQHTIACKSRSTVILTVCCSYQRVFCLGSVRSC